MKNFAILTMVICTSLTACSSGSTKDPAYGGEYFYNFENAIFTPDGKKEDWCLSGISMQKLNFPRKMQVAREVHHTLSYVADLVPEVAMVALVAANMSLLSQR